MKSGALASAIESWHGEGMAKRPVERRDFMQIAREVVERAIGEQMNGSPLESADSGKDAKAISRGHKGGIKGGKARASKLNSTERSAIARKGATARWRKS